MGFEVTSCEADRYIRITAWEPFVEEEAMQAAREALALGARLGVRVFLYDARQSPNMKSILTNYRVAYHELRALDIDPGASAAILVSPDDHSYDVVETLCRNAGYNIRLFRKEGAAVFWIKERGPK